MALFVVGLRLVTVCEMNVENNGRLSPGFPEDGFDGFYDGLCFAGLEELGVDGQLAFGFLEDEGGFVEDLYAGVSVA